MNRALALLACLSWTFAPGCNDHPLDPLDETISAAAHERVEVAAQRQVDLLFVIDDSGSMCAEQAALAENIGRLADFFFDRLGPSADLAIAVTTPDLTAYDGRFVSGPPTTSSCADAPPIDPETCAAVEPVLRLGEGGDVGADCGDDRACIRADFERRFRCLATRGTGGGSREKGLEAMRRALSCDGPNATWFGACCGPGGFAPTCTGDGAEPRFLRPEALLVVVFVSDEDDCSDGAANPAASTRTICRAGPTDADGDGIADGFEAEAAVGHCADGVSCQAAECGGLSPADCWSVRCAVDGDGLSACAWERDALTPPADFVRFLHSRKARPAEQVLVAAIVGDRLITADGHEATWQPGDPASRGPACVAPVAGEPPSATCCPDGACRGEVTASCASAFGEAFPGGRYLEVAEAVGAVGCVDENTSLCSGDLVGPLDALAGCIADATTALCLSKPVADPSRIEVSLVCDDPDRCAETTPTQRLPSDAWRVEPSDACPGGAVLRLATPPPWGSTVRVAYTVAI